MDAEYRVMYSYLLFGNRLKPLTYNKLESYAEEQVNEDGAR